MCLITPPSSPPKQFRHHWIQALKILEPPQCDYLSKMSHGESTLYTDADKWILWSDAHDHNCYKRYTNHTHSSGQDETLFPNIIFLILWLSVLMCIAHILYISFSHRQVFLIYLNNPSNPNQNETMSILDPICFLSHHHRHRHHHHIIIIFFSNYCDWYFGKVVNTLQRSLIRIVLQHSKNIKQRASDQKVHAVSQEVSYRKNCG